MYSNAFMIIESSESIYSILYVYEAEYTHRPQATMDLSKDGNEGSSPWRPASEFIVFHLGLFETCNDLFLQLFI